MPYEGWTMPLGSIPLNKPNNYGRKRKAHSEDDENGFLQIIATPGKPLPGGESDRDQPKYKQYEVARPIPIVPLGGEL